LSVLASALRKRGFTFQSASPYFLNKNWQTRKGTPPNDTGGYGAGTGAGTMGAAYNFNLLAHDPGGFAHNSTYAKRLIFDSILWVATGSTTLTPGLTIADIVADTTAIPTYANLVASSDGSLTDFTGANSIAIRNAAIAWLTNGSPVFIRP